MDSDERIRLVAQELRFTIERAQQAQASIPWLKRFPAKCCNFASNLLLLKLSAAGAGSLRRMIGTVCDERGDDLSTHVWVLAGELTVDITADHYGQPAVIVESGSDWHQSLKDIKPFIAAQDLAEGIEASRLVQIRELYKDVMAELAPFESKES